MCVCVCVYLGVCMYVCMYIQFIVAVNTKSDRTVPTNGAQQHGACSECSTHVRDYNNGGDAKVTKNKM